jgi:transcriptional regulator with XRE-family HTH domain
LEHPNTTSASTTPGEWLGVGHRLKTAREERGFTQGAVANRTKMIDPDKKGISRTAIVGYEQDTSKPGLREIRLLCEVLRISPNWLIYGSESAAVASLPSMELLSNSPSNQLVDVMSTALAMTALKGHERDAVQSLVLSLAGRQLGDMGLSSLMTTSWLLKSAFISALKEYVPEINESMTLEEIAKLIAENGMISNAGNRFRLGEEGQVINPEQSVYPDPAK